MSDSQVLGPLSTQAVGYGIIVGVGALFALGIVGVTRLSSKYLNQNSESTENFMVANRTVGTGLMAASVFSSWMWTAEYLLACEMVYYYGISVGFWFSGGLIIQIALMSVLGIQSKSKIPNGHTSLEVVYARYGAPAHILYLSLCLINNLCAAAMIILGSGSAISAATGVHIVACCLLLPFGVLLYTFVAGLRGTFYTDYLHTFIALILVLYFLFGTIYSKHIGGLRNLYKMAISIDESGVRPVSGNYKGSFLTFRSKNGIFFAWLNSLANFGLTIMDSSYWQKAFSSDFKSTVPGYILGSLAIFAIPFSIGSVIGIANIVIEGTEAFPTYPRAMSTYEVNSGYGLAYTLYSVIGKNSQPVLVLAYFLTTTSTISSELISVSSLICFDIYKRYFNPQARNKQLITVSHLSVVFFTFFSAGFTLLLYYINLDMTWFSYFSTILITPGMFGLILTILWDKHSKWAAIIGPISGLGFGIVVWILTAWGIYGEATVTTLGYQIPNLYGSVVSTFLPGILGIVLSYLIPSGRFDWNQLKEIELVKDDSSSETDITEVEEERHELSDLTSLSNKTQTRIYQVKASSELIEEHSDGSNGITDQVVLVENNKSYFKNMTKLSWIYLGASFFVCWVLFPMPLYRNYIFTEDFYVGWCVVSIIWVFFAFFAVALFPLYDGRKSWFIIFNGLFGKKTKSGT